MSASPGKIRAFDIATPGSEYDEFNVWSRSDGGQKGILSSLAPRPDNSPFLAVGSLSGTVGLYSTDEMELLGLAPAQSYGVTQVRNLLSSLALFDFSLHQFCILSSFHLVSYLIFFDFLHQVRFSPDGNLLIAGGRRENSLLVWDVRKGLNFILHEFHRNVQTNQRIWFDIHSSSRYVGSGGSVRLVGIVFVFSLSTFFTLFPRLSL